MNARYVAALAAVVAACAKPAAPPPDASAIRTALTGELAKVPTVFATKDTVTLANLFTQDATWILPDASTFTGRAAIVAGAKAFFATFDTATVSAMVIDKLIVVNDSEAVTFSHGNYTMKLKGKKPETGVNPFADLWKKEADGVWRIAYEVNASGPAAPPAAPKH